MSHQAINPNTQTELTSQVNPNILKPATTQPKEEQSKRAGLEEKESSLTINHLLQSNPDNQKAIAIPTPNTSLQETNTQLKM